MDTLAEQQALILIFRALQHRLELADAEVQRPGVGPVLHRQFQ